MSIFFSNQANASLPTSSRGTVQMYSGSHRCRICEHEEPHDQNCAEGGSVDLRVKASLIGAVMPEIMADWLRGGEGVGGGWRGGAGRRRWDV